MYKINIYYLKFTYLSVSTNMYMNFNSLVSGSLLDLYVPGDPREKEAGETNLLRHNVGGEVADGELPIADDGVHLWLWVKLHLDQHS